MRKEFRDFESARKFVRKLGLKSQKYWIEYCRSSNSPDDIPKAPDQYYKNKGWKGMGDWLGTGSIPSQFKQYRTFEKAIEFARSLGIKNMDEWREYCKSGEKPDDIPSHPEGTYKKEWKGSGDWLGTGSIAPKDRVYRPFTEAREFARSLGLKNRDEWVQYCKSGENPVDVPADPRGTYKKEWKGSGDWLGTGSIAPKDRVYRPFTEAREFARSLGLKSIIEWKQYCKSGNKPDDIPVNPLPYSNEWTNWGDFLGTGAIAPQNKEYLSAKEAKPVLKKLFNEHEIKNLKDWSKFAKTHGKLLDELHLPSTLLRTYSLDNAKKEQRND
jgi:hypothetical protein